MPDPVTDTLGRQLARFACGVRDGGPPTDVSASVRQRILDTLGLCVAAGSLPTSAAVLGWAADQGGRGQAHAVGHHDLLPAPQAALVNGVLAHSLDYDDTHLPSVLHPSAAVVPAALAAGEAAGASGRAVVAAVAAGLEVCVRLGMAGYDPATRNSTFFEHGQHATSICGTVGGAVSAALLLGLDEDGVLDAVGVAASMAAGIIEANRNGGTVKRLHCGWAANSAVTAAQLAARGITGPPTVLEGRFGFFQAFLHGLYHPDRITDGLGSSWSVPGIFFKPYPANHFTHAAIDAARALRSRGLEPGDVAAARLGVPAAVVRTIGEPIDRKRTPQTGYEAQFSGPYAVSAGLHGGSGLGVGLADFTDALAADPDRRALMAKVTVEPDPACTEIFPYQFPAILEVTTTGGRQLREEVLANRGGPEWPLTEQELAAKFRANAAGLPPDGRAELERQILRLDELPEVGAVLALTSAKEPLDAHHVGARQP